ncbi:hypothetical protein [Streptomyces galilaeus]|uniref:hypothetical protein n=1 Tax=Streptomyces galilaeus TaxID=33899 RepID=UPI00123D7CB2|nr:hypothetical protein [Streptomyces galilaeus]GGW45117.1 hypothetical protein GCM10010350_31280 [Streptomyces galilaeus]
MTNPPVFFEPEPPSDGPYRGWADWYRRSGTADSRSARETLNGWYANFPDRDGMLLSRLRLNEDSEVAQAWDELYIHHLLSRSCEARYEEDETSPDFRLYQSAEYVAGIEVLTLFPEEKLSSEDSRNRRLVDEINRRVRPSFWYLTFHIRRWSSQPRMKHLAKWIQSTIDSIGAPPSDWNRNKSPSATYSFPEVELCFTFFPRLRTTDPKPSEPVVLAGPWLGGFIQPTKRIRDRISKKSGGKYQHHNRPFAVAVSLRDLLCDIEEVVSAVYDDAAVPLDVVNQTDESHAAWTGNGVFGISKAYPEGKNRRLSCIFVLMRGWTPNADEPPRILRFDNPWAERPFPEDILIPEHRLAVNANKAGFQMMWESTAEG